MDFDRAIAPLTREQFFGEHYGRSFVRVAGAAGRFADLIGWDELGAILEQHRLAPPRLKLVQEGRPLDPGCYLTPGLGGTPRLDAGKFAACIAGGATLVLDAVEELAPRVRDLSDAFRDALRAGNYVNLYAGWHAANGFDLHWDSQEAIVLQLTGRKRWQVFEPTRLHPLQDDIEAPEKPAGPPVWDGMLEDGDLLYIPRGWWHMAFPVSEPSLHLTVTVVQPNGADLLRWVASVLRREPEFRRDLPAAGDAEGQAAWLEKLRALVTDALPGDLVERFRAQWEAESFPRPRVNLPDAAYRQLAPIDSDSRIRLTAAHRLHFTMVDGKAEFVANGVPYLLPVDLVPALAMLSDTRAIPFAVLAAALKGERAPENLRKSLEILARAGALLIE